MEELREHFKKETGQEYEWTSAVDGGFTNEYVEWIESKLKNHGVIGDVIDCDNCFDVDGTYLGTTCPKCNRPFRSVKQ